MIYEDERVSQPYVTRAYLAPERTPAHRKPPRR